MDIIISFGEMIIYCVCVVLVAVVIVWILGIAGYPPSADMMKWGRILVILLCGVAFLIWLSSLFGLGGGLPRYFHPSLGYQR